jgi:hypothetical protein
VLRKFREGPCEVLVVPSAKRILSAVFYWTGVTATVLCIASVLAGNTGFVWRFEHARLPLSWILAGAAILAFALAEFVQSAAAKALARSRFRSQNWQTSRPVRPPIMRARLSK